MSINLTGFTSVCDCAATNCSGTTANDSCGVHIREGTSCSASVGDSHYYDVSVASADPWNLAAYYNNSGTADNASSEMDVFLNTSYGYNLTNTAGKLIIITDSAGAKIGCGVLIDPTVPTCANNPMAQSWNPYYPNASNGEYLMAAETQAGDLTFCNPLAGQSVCCSSTGFGAVWDTYNATFTHFSGHRDRRISKFDDMKSALLTGVGDFISIASETMAEFENI